MASSCITAAKGKSSKAGTGSSRSAKSRSKWNMSTAAAARPFVFQENDARTRVHARGVKLAAILVLAALVSACATSRSFKKGDAAVKAGDFDTAVVHFTQAVQENPDRPEYKIALERAQQAASRNHFDKARAYEDKGDL